MDAKDLVELYDDPEWRDRFVDICDLIMILGDCTISDTYATSDALNAAVVLTSAGSAIRDNLHTKHGVPLKEAKLMCALTLGHAELFIDVEKTEPAELAAAIDGELEKKRIQFPFVYNRDLYDKYAELYDEAKEQLSVDEVLALIAHLPPGVFQYGSFTVGPFGVRRSPIRRSLEASREVPAYHCSKQSCRNIHSVRLETGYAAPINREREKLRQVLDAQKEKPSEWWGLAAEISGYASAYYGDRRAGTLIPLIADVLTLEELRALVVELLDGTKGRFRANVEPIVKVQGARDAVDARNRAELLQLALFSTEDDIAESIDRLVRRQVILVPPGEVRRPVTSARAVSGAFRLRGELGQYGVRFRSDDRGVALLRERRLLYSLYLPEIESAAEELDWQLRGVEGETLDERLELFFEANDPREVLERMVLTRRANVISACEEAGLEDYAGLEDEELVSTLLWKLGFPVPYKRDPHLRFWLLHEQLWASTHSLEIGGAADRLGVAAEFFKELEGVLLESLAFTSWVLLNDHVAAVRPFTYDDANDRRAGLELMEGIAPSRSGAAAYTADRVDLANLVSGYSALARHLESCEADKEQYLRLKVEFPEYDGRTTLKTYAFRSTLPFLDLLEASRGRIIHGLRDITQKLSDADVSTVRNEHVHYRREGPGLTQLERVLAATREAVTQIETLGFCRLLFVPTHVSVDFWGASTHYFASERSYHHQFRRPSRFDWNGLPRLDEAAYLVRSASIGTPSEVLRVAPRSTSEFTEMWEGFPKRRRRGGSAALVDIGENSVVREHDHA